MLGVVARAPSTTANMKCSCSFPAELSPPVGVLGYIMGRKGPGKQSSFAFLKNRLIDPQDLCDTSDANRGAVRGLLPLELRGMRNQSTATELALSVSWYC